MRIVWGRCASTFLCSENTIPPVSVACILRTQGHMWNDRNRGHAAMKR